MIRIIYSAALLIVLSSLAHADLVISEVLSDNQTSITDWRGERPDWIEIHNPDSKSVSLEGWFLTDNRKELKKCRFANFKLSKKGEYLALVRPDGSSIAHALNLKDKPQRTDRSFGLQLDSSGSNIDVTLDPEYLRSPTPGTINDVPLCRPVQVDREHGFFDAPISVTMSCATLP